MIALFTQGFFFSQSLALIDITKPNKPKAITAYGKKLKLTSHVSVFATTCVSSGDAVTETVNINTVASAAILNNFFILLTRFVV